MPRRIKRRAWPTARAQASSVQTLGCTATIVQISHYYCAVAQSVCKDVAVARKATHSYITHIEPLSGASCPFLLSLWMAEQPPCGAPACSRAQECGVRGESTEGREAGFIKRSTLRKAQCIGSCTVCRCSAIVVPYM
ncbi:hypothetical protein EJ02DRAFT_451545 [Clathrospora elynae]|uniref:Uncharacterized protein n=1 Tax=Clathrospora elynae TaxID=706981 RepID=A0A6A5T1H9_9PLEO|nr:hypothetical protein EJ02DRAFT_451545 [Clathrospora elynae]